MLTGLSANSTYMVQVLGRSGGGPGDRFIDYCIGVESPDNCGVCSSPCGAACGFPTTPTVAQVTASCPVFELSPHLSDGQSGSWCYTMTAVATSVDFGLIINQIGCAMGNIVTMNWEVYNQGSCTGPVASGAFPTLTATGLTIGSNYTFCYTLQVASGCVHAGHYPFWVGAGPLPVELDLFEGYEKEGDVRLDWIADIENVVEYEVEHSANGIDFVKIGTVSALEGPGKRAVSESAFSFVGTGGSMKAAGLQEFNFTHEYPVIGNNFYRIVEITDNGEIETSDAITVMFQADDQVSSLYPVPSSDVAHLDIIANGQERLELKIIDTQGRILATQEEELRPGKTQVEVSLEGIPTGIYIVEIRKGNENYMRKLQVR